MSFHRGGRREGKDADTITGIASTRRREGHAIASSLALAFIVTAVLAAATTILVMFTKGKELGHHRGLFGSIFFDAHKTDAGSVMVGLGVENPLTLAFIFIIAFAIILVSFHLFAALRRRKE